MRGASRGGLEVGQSAGWSDPHRPECGVLRFVPRKHEPGRLEVTVRAHYGALPLMPAGRGLIESGEIPPETVPEERSPSPKSPPVARLMATRSRKDRDKRYPPRQQARRRPSWFEG